MGLDDKINTIIDQCFLDKSNCNKKNKDTYSIASAIENITADATTTNHVNTPPTEPNYQNNFEQILDSIDINFGTIQVTEDGIKVTGRRNQDVLATLTPCQGVTVVVNGTEVKGSLYKYQG